MIWEDTWCHQQREKFWSLSRVDKSSIDLVLPLTVFIFMFVYLFVNLLAVLYKSLCVNFIYIKKDGPNNW